MNKCEDRSLKFEWDRINNDTYGNPRYVTHFLNLVTEDLRGVDLSLKYALVCKFANKLGGKKFHNKQYGGGVVFQSYNLKSTENYIIEQMNKVNEKVTL
jgi:hypothetical protein